jgi:hypothetical protein
LCARYDFLCASDEAAIPLTGGGTMDENLEPRHLRRSGLAMDAASVVGRR